MLTKFIFALLGILVFTVVFVIWNSRREEKMLSDLEADVFGSKE